jgi:hypothetical protein
MHRSAGFGVFRFGQGAQYSLSTDHFWRKAVVRQPAMSVSPSAHNNLRGPIGTITAFEGARLWMPLGSSECRTCCTRALHTNAS